LHPFVTVSFPVPEFPSFSILIGYHQICWYLAAVVQVQVCKHFIEVGDAAREDQVWGEINVLRYVVFQEHSTSIDYVPQTSIDQLWREISHR